MVLSILLDSQQIHILRGRYRSGKVRLTHAVAVPTPPGAVRGGAVVDAEAVARVLRETLDSHRIRTKKVRMLLSSPLTVFRDLVLPQAPDRQLAQMVRSELLQALNPEEEYFADYEVTGQLEEDGKRFVRVSATAVSAEMVHNYAEVLRLAKLKGVSLDVCQNSLAQFAEHLTDAGEDPCLLLDIFGSYQVAVLSDRYHRVLTRSVQLAGQYTDDEDRRDTVSNLTLQNISKVLMFFRAQFPDRPVKRVFYTGKLKEYPQLLENLTATFELQPQAVGPGPAIERSAPVNIGEYCALIGGLVTHRNPNDAVNLFDGISVEKTVPKPRAGFARVLCAVSLILAVFLGSGSFFIYRRTQALRDEAAPLEAYCADPQVLAQAAEAARLGGLVQQAQSYAAWMQQLKQLLAEQPALDAQVLDTVREQLPEGVVLLAMDFSLDNRTLYLSCTAPDNILPSSYAQALEETALFETVRYPGYSESAQEGGAAQFAFSVECVLSQMGGEQQ